MPSSFIPASAPNFSNIGRQGGGHQIPFEVLPPILSPTNNRPESFARSFRRKLRGLKRSTNKNNNNIINSDFTKGGGDSVKRALPARTILEIITQPEEKHKNGPSSSKDCSPYYRGLLTNLPQRFFLERAESHAASTTGYTKASYSSSFFVRIQAGIGSCMPFRSKKEDNNNEHDEPPMATPSVALRNTTANVTTAISSPSPTFVSLPSPPLFASDMTKQEVLAKEIATSSLGNKEGSNSEKKPLRESKTTSRPAHQAMPLPDDQPMISTSQEVDHVDQKDIKEEEKTLMDGEREFLWADKYRPKALADFICNRSKAIQLLALARKGDDCGHFIFEGPTGVGKRTMIWAMVREAFGPDSVKASEVYKVFNLKGEVVGSIEVLVKESPRLVEVNLSDLKGYEKHVIFQLLKETFDLKMANKSALPFKSSDNCRAIIFYGADKLSTDAILYVKWLLERYQVSSKIFFCCHDASKLQAIKDICTVVQLLRPTRTEIIEVLKFIAEKEGIELPHQLAEKITDTSNNNNLRQAIRSFEATWFKHYPFTEDHQVLTGWEDVIANIAKSMVHEQSPKLLYIIRGTLQDLIDHDVPPEFIFQSLVDELKKHLHDLLKRRVQNLYVEYNRKDENVFENDKAMGQTRRNNNLQQFLTIEEFIAKFMSCYKNESAKLMQQESDDHHSEV